MSNLARLAAASFATGATLLAFAVMAAGGCAVTDKPIAVEDGGTPISAPAFVEVDAQTEPVVPMCISYDCPAPYATCLDKPGLCNTNLKTDVNNCGACGKKCFDPDGGFSPNGGNGDFSCMDGECYLQCPAILGDCNGQLEDGCEALLMEPANCGGCGNACKEGEVCWNGACGCPPGFTQCGNDCTQLDRDPENCSACGRKCTTSDVGADAWVCGEGVLPVNYGPVCNSSSCDLGCIRGQADCNNDLCGDGCETYLARDPKNCGACGHACLPEQECYRGKCQCEDPAFSLCRGFCIDLMNDLDNCGSCGNVCPGSKGVFKGIPICELGRCSYYCPPGLADCDGRVDNGCEVDLMVDPLNCGGCGVHCDLENGQPCAEGRCLTKPCDVPDAGGVF